MNDNIVILKHTKEATEPETVYLQCVQMPNGEIIHQGKTVSTHNRSKDFIYKL
jgi:hypothetical protein